MLLLPLLLHVLLLVLVGLLNSGRASLSAFDFSQSGGELPPHGRELCGERGVMVGHDDDGGRISRAKKPPHRKSGACAQENKLVMKD